MNKIPKLFAICTSGATIATSVIVNRKERKNVAAKSGKLFSLFFL